MDFFFSKSNTTDYSNQTMEFQFDNPEEIFAKSVLRFTIYSSVCSLQVIFGLVANVLTLVIIKQLIHRSNGHIGMTYLAVSDVLAILTYPLTFLYFCFGNIYWQSS